MRHLYFSLVVIFMAAFSNYANAQTYADAIQSYSGVLNPTAILQSPDAIGAELYMNGDVIIVHLDGTIPSGSQYQIRWAKRNGGTDAGNARPIVMESSTSSGFNTNPNLVYAQNLNFGDHTYTASTDINYLKITKADPYPQDFKVDAIIYGGVVVPPPTNEDCPNNECHNVTNAGTIGIDQTVCIGVTPAQINSLVLPSGGIGDLEYVWLSNTSGPSTSGATTIAHNAPTYTPGPLSQTTWFRRCSRRVGCSSYPGESNWIKITVLSNCCDNVTDGGEIGFEEFGCFPYDPAEIVSVTDPTGGSGGIQIVWLKSSQPIDEGGYSVITGATGLSYDPGVITEPTYFRRCARRVGCSSFVGESNDILKGGDTTPPIAVNFDPEITANCGDDLPEISFNDINEVTVITEELPAAKVCEIDFSTYPAYANTNIWFHAFPSEYTKWHHWEDGWITIFPDNTVRINGRIVNNDLPGSGFIIEINFQALQDFNTFVAGGNYVAGDPDAANRLYANVNFNAPHSVIGFGEFEDSEITLIGNTTLHHMDLGPSMVYGGDGYGFWISYEGHVNGVPVGSSSNVSGNKHLDMYSKINTCYESSGDCEEFISRKITATDACGNTNIYVQAVTIVDTENPVLVNVPASTTGGACGEIPSASDLNVTATDNCSTATVSATQNNTGDVCNGITTITWTATDECGNTASETRTFEYGDLDNPILAGVPASTTGGACGEIPSASDFNVTATDNCSNVTVAAVENSTGDVCNGITTITWTATDECGNAASETRTFEYGDLDNPILAGVPASTTGGECGEIPSASDFNVTATDNCSSATVAAVENSTGDVCNGITTITWTATDECGNTASETRTFEYGDIDLPALLNVPDSDPNIECTAVPSASDFNIIATDNCSTANVSSVETNDGTPCNGEMTITWTAMDACGNSVSETRTFTYGDLEGPILIGVPADMTLSDPDIPVPTITATDNCSDDVTVVFEEVNNNTGDVCGFTVDRIWTATDDCGNISTGTQVLTVTDNLPPVVISTPPDLTLGCNDELPTDEPVFDDMMDDELVVTTSESSNNINCGIEIIRTWTAVDNCLNEISTSQSIQLIDTEGPVFSENPADVEVDCSESAAIPVVTATDFCQGVIAVSFNEEMVNGTGTCPNALLRTWTASDSCGNTSSIAQLVNFTDNEAPVFPSLPNDITIECGEDIPFSTPEVTDNCSENLVPTMSETQSGDNCNLLIVREWTAIDDCGNVGTGLQNIHVIDTTAPTLSSTPNNITVECDAIPQAVILTATDICEGIVLVSFSEVIGNGCPFYITRTWTATDACGNESAINQTITVEDTTAPIFENTPENIVVQCLDEVPLPAVVSATDNCDNEVAITFSEDDAPNECGEGIRRFWIATDDCGNTAMYEQSIAVSDTTAPEAVNIPQNLVLSCTDVVPDGAPIFNDNCDDNVEVESNEISEGDVCLTIITRSWTGTDNCGNELTVSQTISIADEVAPVLNGVPANAVVSCDAIPNAPAVTATDACQGDQSVAYSEVETDGCPYEITRTWTTSDACGNISSATQVLTVEDNMAPEINSPADAVADCNNGSTDPSDTGEATATDNCSTPDITYADSPITGDCPASFIRTWTATDLCGNTTSYNQMIMIDDNTAPALSSPNDITIDCEQSTDPLLTGQASATDDCSEINIGYVDGDIQGSCPYTITRTWTATDACGNTDSQEQLITIQDTTAPIFIGLPADTTIECLDQLPEVAVISASDNCDNNVLITYVQDLPTSECGEGARRTWTATDACGNQTIHQQSIAVNDITPPSILSAPVDVTIECDQDLPTDEPIFSDNCDSNPEITLNETSSPITCGIQLTREWIATDNCDNETVVTQVVSVIDTTAPILTGVPDDTIVQCDAIPESPEVTAMDACDGNQIVELSEEISEGCPYTITRTWVSNDACGNISSAIQILTVEDNIAPEISGPADAVVDCNNGSTDPSDTGEATAMDNCSTPVVTYADSPITGDCPASFLRTWTATDLCGNTTTYNQMIMIDDNTAPALSSPNNITIDCEQSTEPLITGQATATDDCSEINIDYVDGDIQGSCPYTITRTWTATDACGNADSQEQLITIEDTTAPIFIGLPADTIIECLDQLPEVAVVTASDNCDNNVLITYVQDLPTSECGEGARRTWTATDACGNQTIHQQSIAINDITPPTIESAPADITIECDEPTPNVEPIFSDNCDPSVDVTLVADTSFMTCGIILTREWTAIDNCGNESVVTQVISVMDTTPPVLDGVPTDITVECDAIPEIASVSSMDACDDEQDVEFNQVISDGCPYTITRTWTSSDECGNTVTDSQVITVEDNTNPVIVCPENANVNCDNGSTDPVDTGEATASDNCGGVNITYTDGSISGQCPASFIRTWVATDSCNNTSSCEQLIMINDNTAPVITCPSDITIDCEQNSDPLVTGNPIVLDDCSDVVVNYADSDIQGSCPYNFTRTFTANDACGNTTSCVQLITIEDNVAPSFIELPGNLSFTCPEEIPSPFNMEAIDNCDNDLDITFNEFGYNGTDCIGTLTRVWTVTDNCDNTFSHTQLISVSDTISPVMFGLPSNLEVQCLDEVPEAPEVTATDNCAGEVTVVMSEDPVNNECGEGIRRTWVATDACGNQSIYQQSIAVSDTTSPEANNIPANLNLECDAEVPSGEPTFSDNCDTDLDVVFSTTTTEIDCGILITNTWVATDNCGYDIEVIQTISLTDNTPPVLSVMPPDITVLVGEVPQQPAVSATDNCDTDVTVVLSTFGYNGTACQGVLTRRWTAIDDCGNQTIHEQHITIGDPIPPTLIGVPDDVNTDCFNLPAIPSVSGEDNSGLPVIVDFVETINGDNCNMIVIRTWTATDECGNQTSESQTLTFLDELAPVFEPASLDNIEVSCDNIPDAVPVSASDNCDDNVSIEFSQVISDGCPYTITRTWIATDNCNNSSTLSRIITVVDNVNPVLNNLPDDVSAQCGAIPAVASVIATDNCGEPLLDFNEELISESCPLIIERTWTATDACGNTATHTQTISYNDEIAPIITPLGGASLENATVSCDAIPALPVVDVIDNCDSPLEASISEDIVNNDCGAIITRTYTAADACNNITTIIQILTVIDEEAPVLSPLPADITVECGQVPNPVVVSATDNCDNDVNVVISQFGYNGFNCEGHLTRKWTAIDNCGNQVTHTQIITIEDTTAPVFGQMPENFTVECLDEVPEAPEVTATDNCDDDVTITLVVDLPEDECGEGIRRTWTATDDCGNQSFYQQSIAVSDTTAPELISVPADTIIECGSIIPQIEASFIDNCDNDLDITYNQVQSTTGCSFTLTRTWIATDNCGNHTQAVQVINISDNTPPTLIGAPLDATIECNESHEIPPVSANDNCDDELNVAFEEVVISNECPFIFERTWTAVDNCGNTATHTQTLTVVDTTAPELIGVPENVTGDCFSDLPAIPAVTAVDNCDDDLIINYVQTIDGNDCDAVVTRTWTAIDMCGNETSASQTLTYADTEAPIISPAPGENAEDATVECTEIPNIPEMIVSDNCDANVTIEFEESISEGCPFTITRNWLSTDACGNTGSFTQIISVVDTQEPVLIGVPANISGQCGEVPATANVTASDNCSVIDVQYSEVINSESCPTDILRTWTATDACGNTISATQSIIFNDDIAPVITPVGGASLENMVVSCDAIPDLPQITASDNCDINPNISVDEVSALLNCGGTITRTYSASDNCGNETVIVQVLTVYDDIAPVFTTTPANITVECGQVPPATVMSATDNCDNDVTIVISQFGYNGINCQGVLTRRWTAVDNCGNSTIYQHTITIEDTHAPELVQGLETQTIECTDAIPQDEPQFTDNCDQQVELSLEESTQDSGCGFVLTKTWTAIDDCGNTATYSQDIIISDFTGPILVGVPADTTVQCSSMPNVPLVSANDACDDEIIVEFTESMIVTDCPYQIQRTWTATDACGNSSTASQIITVTDEEAPILNGIPENITVTCDAIPDVTAIVTAIDNCDDDIQVTFEEVIQEEGCPYIIYRNWIAVDACGNQVIGTQEIEVVDNDDPVFDPYDSAINIHCDAWEELLLTATDGCDNDVEVTVISEQMFSGVCIGTVERIYLATDNCGNTATAVQFLFLQDTIAPTVIDPPVEEITVICGDPIPTPPIIEGIDNCSSDVSIAYTEEFSADDCPYVITRTWILTDVCSNQTAVTQLVNIVPQPEAMQDGVVITSAPNPFDASTKVTFTIPFDAEILFEVVNPLGKKVQVLHEGRTEAEILYEFELETSTWEDGMYYLKLYHGDKMHSYKIMKIR